MKITILTSFVALALASTGVMANVLPLASRSDLGTSDVTNSGIAANVVGAAQNIPSSAGSAGSTLTSTAQRRHNYLIDTRTTSESDNNNATAMMDSLLSRGEHEKDNHYDLRDIQYLNFALVLQQALTAFFDRGLSRYSQEQFLQAGYPAWVRGRYLQIAEHERIHKDFLQSAVTAAGGSCVKSCHYEFTDTDIRSFVDVSEALQTIATSAYVGSLQNFNNRAYITTGASILAVKARQASWINSAVRKLNPWNTAFETPLTPNQVATLLSTFFSFASCPSENNALLPPNFHAYPRLSLAPRLVPGQEAEISFPYPNNLQPGERLYIAFLVGIETIFAPVEVRSDNNNNNNNEDKKSGGENKKEGDHKNGNSGNDSRRYFVALPRDLAAKGTVYFVLVRGGEDIRSVRLDDQTIIAGPAIAEFPFDADNKPIGW